METMNKSEASLTYRLFSRPSFLEGMCRVMDMGNTLQVYNRSRTSAIADHEAIESDWRMVGRDIKVALRRHGQKEQK